MGYKSDREFTNKVHQGLATEIIYDKLGWTQAGYSNLEHIDVKRGIDYMLIENQGKMVVHTVQERFRESKYSNYGDFTIRYTRENNMHADRRQLEYFKIEAEYFVYGIINTSKDKVDRATDFIKYAVIDMNLFRQKIDDEMIYVDIRNKGKSRIINGRLAAGYNINSDGSSEFVAFEIEQIIRLFGHDMVLLQKGFV